MSSQTMYLSLAYIMLMATAISVSAMSELNIHQVTLADLKNPSGAVLQQLKEAVYHHGIFAVVDPIQQQPTITDDESIHQETASSGPFAGTLAEFVQCAQEGRFRDHKKEVSLLDGTIRTTLATRSEAGSPIPFPSAVEAECPSFVAASSHLREAVEETGQAYASVLDILQEQSTGLKASHPYLNAVRTTESLEHFHVYSTTQADGTTDQPTLRLHSDIGLFIVMTAAEYYNTASPSVERLAPGAGKPEAGFVLELANGELVKPIIPDGSLLVMNGDASGRWTWPGLAAPTPFSPGHEMNVPYVEDVARAWFGRMYFPPSDAKLAEVVEEADAHLTFGEYRRQQFEVFRDGTPERASAVGCTQTRRLLQDEGSCTGDDEFYCWHRCMSIADLPCGKDSVECASPNGMQWPADFINATTGQSGHCMTCNVTCAADPTNTIAGLLATMPEMSTLVTLLKMSPSLWEAVNDPTTAVTVIAPDNDAFAKVLKQLRLPEGFEFEEFLLTRVLSLHILPEPVTSRDVPTTKTKVMTLAPGKINVENRGGEVYVNKGIVTEADLMAGPSVVHVINEVIFPQLDTWIDLMKATNEFWYCMTVKC